MRLNEREDILDLTREWTGERFPNGRPRVSDEKIEIIKTLTQEEIWHPLYFSGYRFQFQGGLRTLHPGKKLYGRAVTCCFAPQRPDVRRNSFGSAAAKHWKGDCNQWVIDSLTEGDVVVCDLYDKIYKGTFAGGQPDHGHQGADGHGGRHCVGRRAGRGADEENRRAGVFPRRGPHAHPGLPAGLLQRPLPHW